MKIVICGSSTWRQLSSGSRLAHDDRLTHLCYNSFLRELGLVCTIFKNQSTNSKQHIHRHVWNKHICNFNIIKHDHKNPINHYYLPVCIKLSSVQSWPDTQIQRLSRTSQNRFKYLWKCLHLLKNENQGFSRIITYVWELWYMTKQNVRAWNITTLTHLNAPQVAGLHWILLLYKFYYYYYC